MQPPDLGFGERVNFCLEKSTDADKLQSVSFSDGILSTNHNQTRTLIYSLFFFVSQVGHQFYCICFYRYYAIVLL